MSRSSLIALFAICMLGPMVSQQARSADTAGPGQAFLIVANKGDHTVGIIDPQAGRQIATVAEGGVTGHELTASPDGRTIYVPIYGDSGVGKPGTDGSNIVVIDRGTRKIVGIPAKLNACSGGKPNGIPG